MSSFKNGETIIDKGKCGSPNEGEALAGNLVEVVNGVLGVGKVVGVVLCHHGGGGVSRANATQLLLVVQMSATSMSLRPTMPDCTKKRKEKLTGSATR